MARLVLGRDLLHRGGWCQIRANERVPCPGYCSPIDTPGVATRIVAAMQAKSLSYPLSAPASSSVTDDMFVAPKNGPDIEPVLDGITRLLAHLLIAEISTTSPSTRARSRPS